MSKKKKYNALDLIESITIESEKNVELNIIPKKYSYIDGKTVVDKYTAKFNIDSEVEKTDKYYALKRLKTFINIAQDKFDVINACVLFYKNKGFKFTIQMIPTKIDKDAIDYIKEVFD